MSEPHRIRPRLNITIRPEVRDAAEKHVSGSSSYRSVSHLIEELLALYLDIPLPRTALKK